MTDNKQKFANPITKFSFSGISQKNKFIWEHKRNKIFLRPFPNSFWDRRLNTIKSYYDTIGTIEVGTISRKSEIPNTNFVV